MKRALGLVCCMLAVAGTSGAAHADNLRTERYSSTGNWTISALYDGGRFLSCYARVSYRNGINVSLIAYNNSKWTIQFYNENWPKRAVSRFPASLIVDGRTLLNTNATYRGRSVFIDIGRSIDRVRPLMRGRVMTIRSDSGTSSFKLTGSFRAANHVARCWVRHTNNNRRSSRGDAFNAPPRSNNRNNGAFGSSPQPNNGDAFGNQPQPPRNRNDDAFGNPRPGQGAFNRRQPAPRTPNNSTVLSRGGTMEYAVRYLAKSRLRYEILPVGDNFFKNFPVNWRYDNGRLGAMLVLTMARPNAESGIKMLLTDQTQLCSGRNATERRPTTGEPGRRIAQATGICESNGSVSKLDYYAVEFGDNRLALIVEMSRGPLGGQPRTNPPQREPGPNEAGGPPSHQPNNPEPRIPGPNEL
ncbi:MAG: hypothetical protein AAGC70_11915 [Pseudomonadota bacterium]